jgi:hypothetical protein
MDSEVAQAHGVQNQSALALIASKQSTKILKASISIVFVFNSDSARKDFKGK